MTNTSTILPQETTAYKQSAREERIERFLRSRGYEVRPVLFLGAHLQRVIQQLIDEDEASAPQVDADASAPIGQAVEELPAASASASNIRATGTHIHLRVERVRGR